MSFRGGNAEEAYLHAVRRTFELFTSLAILTETANILRTKFEWSDEKVEQLLESISKTATAVKTQPHLHILQDGPDNRILECALLAEANIIVSVIAISFRLHAMGTSALPSLLTSWIS